MIRTADVSACGRYRYSLTRRWEPMGELATFVMLNPSTADAELDDPTIRRCIGFAQSWGLTAIRVVNLFAYRSTDPRGLVFTDDPIGPDNDRALIVAARAPGPMIAAWGLNAPLDRVANVLDILPDDRLECLGVTKSGAPRHPLYLPSNAERRPWPVP